MVEILILGPILSFVFLAIIILFAMFFGKGIVWLIINSVIGLVALVLVNLLPIVNITINIWSVLIVAFGGILGFILLIILSAFGIAF
jgi:hypothetical protein